LGRKVEELKEDRSIAKNAIDRMRNQTIEIENKLEIARNSLETTVRIVEDASREKDRLVAELSSLKRKKQEIFLSKSVSFAIETVRASLRHIPTPTNLRLDGLWMQMNMGTDLIGDESYGSRFITMAILIYPSIRVHADCLVCCEKGEWKLGDVIITFPGDTDRSGVEWKFHCQLVSGELIVQPI